MTDQEILEFISRNGGHPRAFYRFIEVLLRHLEDILWQWHAQGRYEDQVGPLFNEGGPPRYYYCYGDLHDPRGRHEGLSRQQRSLLGPAHFYIQALHRRLFTITWDGGPSRPAHAWRHMYDIWRYFVDGREMQLQIRGMAYAMAFAHGVGNRAGAAMAARERIPAFPETVPAAGAPAAARTTLPGIGPDIGHADTLPAIAARQPSRTLPGIGPGPSSPPTPTGQTLRGIGPEIEGPRPAPAPGGSTGGPPPNDMRPLVEEASAGSTPPPAGRTSRPDFGRHLPPGGRIEPLTEQQRLALNDNHVIGNEMEGFNNYLPNASGAEMYAVDWQQFGGTGPPPPHGFIVRNADGSTYRVVGYGRGTLRR